VDPIHSAGQAGRPGRGTDQTPLPGRISEINVHILELHLNIYLFKNFKLKWRDFQRILLSTANIVLNSSSWVRKYAWNALLEI
jgi:hypothetical protein